MAQKKAPTVKSLTAKFRSIGLVENTSPVQKSNGTLSFHDTETEVNYNFLKSGFYARQTGSSYVILNPLTRKKNGSTKRVPIKDRAVQMQRALDVNIENYRD